VSDAEPTFRDNTGEHRFEVLVDGNVAGVVTYHDRGSRRSFLHTEIDPAYEGHGLGSRLVRHVLDDARTNGYDVLPHCPFVRAYIDEHRTDYLDLVPEGDRAQFGLD
jgi:predicted GNAT family acetyltransferase